MRRISACRCATCLCACSAHANAAAGQASGPCSPPACSGRIRQPPAPTTSLLPPLQAMRTAILLNCGAAEDVRQLLELDQRPNVRVIIVDSHRPVCHTANLDDPADAVHILLDEAEGCSKADIPPFDPGACLRLSEDRADVCV